MRGEAECIRMANKTIAKKGKKINVWREINPALYLIIGTGIRKEGGFMEIKKCVCNDCGCRFEFRILKDGEFPILENNEEKSQKTEPRRIPCPQCESYNVTTA